MPAHRAHQHSSTRLVNAYPEKGLLKQLLPQVKTLAQDPVTHTLPSVRHPALLGLCWLKGACSEGGQGARPRGCSQAYWLCSTGTVLLAILIARLTSCEPVDELGCFMHGSYKIH